MCSTDYDITNGINFLTELFYKDNLGYSAMNTARSALSTIMVTTTDQPFGSHPLVKRLLKGMFKIRPNFPKLVCTFDVDIVLRYLDGLGDANILSFKMLTFRLATLFCLLSAQRDQTLAAIDVRLIQVSDERILIYHTLKTTRPNFHQSPLDFRAFPQCKNICPVYNAQKYLQRSFSLRGPFVKFFISYNYPHHPVGTSTISRWVKNTLELAGIDINIFTSHSTRAASASKAKSIGVSLAAINKAAGWSNTKTFGQFYNKTIIDTNIGENILNHFI